MFSRIICFQTNLQLVEGGQYFVRSRSNLSQYYFFLQLQNVHQVVPSYLFLCHQMLPVTCLIPVQVLTVVRR